MAIRRSKKFRATLGYRTDRVTIKTNANYPDALFFPDTLMTYGLARLEYVYDNSLNPALNIWDGLRYKLWVDVNAKQITRIQKANTHSMLVVTSDIMCLSTEISFGLAGCI
jgi:hypothetical protein